MQKLLTPLAIVITGLIIAASNLFVAGKIDFRLPGGSKTSQGPAVPISPKPSPENPALREAARPEVKEITVGRSPSLGSPSAIVTVIEFSDFQCPFCAAVFGVGNAAAGSLRSNDAAWEPTLPGLKKDYIDKGLVRFVYKDFAFLGEESETAANAALCAGDQDKYWSYHDLLFQNQSGENQGAFREENLIKLADRISLDQVKFGKCLKEKAHLQEVRDNTNLARLNGVRSTPTFFINKKPIVGAVSYSEIKRMVEEALAGR